jgi:hypothetical protein
VGWWQAQVLADTQVPQSLPWVVACWMEHRHTSHVQQSAPPTVTSTGPLALHVNHLSVVEVVLHIVHWVSDMQHKLPEVIFSWQWAAG